jgi:7-cyano-7-deazaguanine synthase
MGDGCIVLFSGGQDSTTCLYWAKDQFETVVALNVQYGQRHQREIDSARKIAALAGIELVEVEFGAFRPMAHSAMLQGVGSVQAKNEDGLPATFLPGRNLVFFSLAGSLAYARGFFDIVTGVCQTDYSGYPDCRNKFVGAAEGAISLALDREMRIHVPLMFLTKADTVKMARRMPGCWEGLALSHTCYEGKHPACGECPSCKLRAKGFAEAGEKDPAEEV